MREAFTRHARIPLLDGIRATTCLMVIASHTNPSCCGWLPGRTALLSFFVMSGFLITWLLAAEQEERGTIALGRFYARRALRIFPPFYIYWLIGLALTLALGGVQRWSDALTSLVYISNYTTARDSFREPFVSHLWSLSVEEQFYLIWPFAYRWLALRGPRTAARALAVFIVAVWAWRIFAALHGAPWYYLFGSFETRADQFAIGCLLAVLIHGRLAEGWLMRPTAAIASLAGLLAVIVAEYRLPVNFTFIAGLPLSALLIGFFIAQAVPNAAHPLFHWLEWRPLVALGRISYSVYLFHVCCQIAVQRFCASASTAVRLPLVMALSVGFGVLMHRWVERPILARRP
ncbi:MAG: acyltransferase family protein [Longimicrobiales bacterium]